MINATRRHIVATGLGAFGVTAVGATALSGGADQCEKAGILCVRDSLALAGTTVPIDVVALIVTRYDRASPVCPALYERANGTATGPGFLRSLDGAFWRLNEPVIDVAMMGAGADAITRALASLGGRPGTIRLRGELYQIKTPIRLASGQSLIGAGWASLDDATVAQGSTVLQLKGTDACIEVIGETTSRPVERVRIAALAVVGEGEGKGIHVRDARHCEFENIYLTRLATGIFGEATAWLGSYSRIQCFACRIGFDLNSGTEDSVFRSCIVRYADIACRINYHGQTNYFVGCDFGYARVSVQMIGAIGKRVNATFESCIFEFKPMPGAGAAIFELTAPTSSNLADYPSVSCRGCRFHALDEQRSAPIFLVRHANKISMMDCRGGGQMATIIQCSDVTALGGLSLAGNEAVARDIMAGDPKLGTRIVDLIGDTR
jgi:hypothetical protein